MTLAYKSFPAIILFLIMCAGTIEAKTNVSKQAFGNMPDGTAIDAYTLNDGRVGAKIIIHGGILVSLSAPDKAGNSQADRA